jgi:hypothetical protein
MPGFQAERGPVGNPVHMSSEGRNPDEWSKV